MTCSTIQLRPPTALDGYAVHQLVAHCPPLDVNSIYCNLLQTSHFADTCISAWQEGVLVGFVSGYCVPNHSQTLFIWQIAVSEQVRGQGLAKTMLLALLQQPACQNVSMIETTITKTNVASRKVFHALAQTLNTELEERVCFDHVQHFNGAADSEYLMRIGPFSYQAKV